MLITWLVRFAALLSVIGLIFKWPDKELTTRAMEVVMLVIWIQMEYSGYKRKDNKN